MDNAEKGLFFCKFFLVRADKFPEKKKISEYNLIFLDVFSIIEKDNMME